MSMNKQEAAKLLSIIKLSYPTAYRDIDKETATATVNMWAMSFPDVPYPIMEQGFNHYRLRNKFPPTVAEMVEELRHIHYQAIEGALIHKNLGNQELVDRFREVMACTQRYKDDDFGGLNISSLPRMIGGDSFGERIGPAHQGLYSCTEGRNELWQVEGPATSC